MLILIQNRATVNFVGRMDNSYVQQPTLGMRHCILRRADGKMRKTKRMLIMTRYKDIPILYLKLHWSRKKPADGLFLLKML